MDAKLTFSRTEKSLHAHLYYIQYLRLSAQLLHKKMPQL